MLKRFLHYYKPHKVIFTLDMLASFFMAMIAILYPIITRVMLNDLIPERKYRLIVIAGLGLLLIYIVRMFLNFFVIFLLHFFLSPPPPFMIHEKTFIMLDFFIS